MRNRFLLALLLCASTTLATAQNKAGLATRTFHPKEVRNWRGADHKELRCILWYPAAAGASETRQLIGPPETPFFEAGTAAPNADFAPMLAKSPLIVLSHGTGGSAAQLAWLGTALARAGYIAVAVDHPGNNAREPYTPEGFTLWWERATDLSNIIDGMLADPEFGPRVDPTRIGAAGFSLGGYTVMEIAGATTDVQVLDELCHNKPATAVCNPPEMKGLGTGEEMSRAVQKTSRVSLARSAESFRDPRVKAVFAIAPALAFTQTRDSLHAIRIPVEIVVGAADTIAPARDNADYLRSNIKGARETILPGGVAHYTFLDTCTPAGKSTQGPFCTDAPGIDRDAIHTEVSTQATAFFNHALKIGKGN